ncbi:MAG: enoyl-CoA hydratase/isomerase family protein [bacterium]|nr:enoyl-CoA hydratase/isomerase family protein [bacterium]
MIERTQEGPIAILRMAHGKASALDLEFLGELLNALEEEQAGDCSGVVMTGTGKIFSAGVDLNRILEGPAYVAEFIPALNRFLWALAEFEKPTVAAINGHAIAGGCVIACAADRRIMVDDGATIGVPELLVGVPFPPSALEVLRVALPANSLREVTLTGRSYSPSGALSKGLVDELTPKDDLISKALQVANQMADVPTASFLATKQQIWAPYRTRARKDVEQELVKIWSLPEVQANISAFIKKTLGRKS